MSLEVGVPQRLNRVLTTHVSHGKGGVLVFKSLHTETSGDHNFTKLQLIQNCLPSSIQAHYEDAYFLFAKKVLEEV